MRHSLATLLVVPLMLLAGCSDSDSDSTVGDVDTSPTAPSGSPIGSPTGSPSADPVVVALLSETGGGGPVADVLAPVEGAALSAFLRRLDPDSLAEEVREAVAGYDVHAGHSLGVAVVAVECDVPGQVYVAERDGEWTIAAARVSEPLPNCSAPITTVAVVDVPGVLPAAA